MRKKSIYNSNKDYINLRINEMKRIQEGNEIIFD